VIKGFRAARVEGLAYHETHPEAPIDPNSVIAQQ
jgi:hypothetical protein